MGATVGLSAARRPYFLSDFLPDWISMRACLQRVTSASVSVGGTQVGACKRGFLVLLGVGPADTSAEVNLLLNKITNLRVFDDKNGKMNLSLTSEEVQGELLVVSQFTLYANCRRGRRPSFTEAAPPQLAEELYNEFCTKAESLVPQVGRGVFGANMQVELTNDGPVTIWLDTDDLR